MALEQFYQGLPIMVKALQKKGWVSFLVVMNGNVKAVK